MPSIFDILSNNKDKVGSVVEIDINSIEPSRYQPRLDFDEEALEELTKSIQVNGLIQPITVRETDGHYEIIAGERRYRACKKAGYEKVACYILSPSEGQAAEMALVENIQREDLTAIEEAKAYVEIMRQSSLTQEQVAQKVGKSQSSVANKIRLLNLPQEIQDGVLSRTISERHARALLQASEDKRVDIYHKIVDEDFNVRQTEAYIEQINAPKQKKRKQITRGYSRNIQIGLNTVNKSIEMVKGLGINVDSTIEESDTDIKMIIRFPK